MHSKAPTLMSTRVLYISYTGLLDPLGQSQVLQYVLGLAREHRMTLLTFEKPAALADAARLAEVRAQCEAAGVRWHHLRYHNRPNLPATLYDLICGIRAGVRLARECGAQVVHCRSYIAGLMGLAVKRATGAKYIFDMRGFWPDERVDGGIWSKTSLQYRVFKGGGAAAVPGRRSRGLADPRRRARVRAVSTTCSGLRAAGVGDPDLHQPRPVPPGAFGSGSRKRGFTLGYIGSVGSWYMFEEVARVVRMLFDAQPSKPASRSSTRVGTTPSVRRCNRPMSTSRASTSRR